MEFTEFKESIHTRWQNHLRRISWIGTVVVFVFEVAVFIAFLLTNFLTTSPFHYCLIRVIIPSGINFLTALISSIVAKSNRYTVVQKDYAASLAIFALGSTVSIFHNYYKFLLVAIGLPILTTAIFADRKLLKTILRLSYVTFALAVIVMWFDDLRLGMVDMVTTIICAFIFIQIVYTIARNVVIYQSEQIDFIHTSSKRQNELIQELKIEPLTKLYNRTALNGAMKSYVRKFNDKVCEPHMALIDLDHFKNINDTYGHSNGDVVLIALADVIRENMGGIRHSFRFGGEEFVLLFDTETTPEVMKILEAIRVGFCSHIFDFAPGDNFTLSAGIAKLQSNWDDTTWFNAADEAMYNAKESGRNKVELYSE